MAVSNFIPQIWSVKLNEALQKSLVYGNVVNHDYEGEITGAGDTVKINSIGDVTIGTYTGADIGAPEELNSAQTTLTIDQSPFFNFAVDDVDKAQANVDLLTAGINNAAYRLADTADKYIASLYTGVDANNTIGSDAAPITPTKENAYDHLVDLSVKLDEANVPSNGRFCVVPSWYHGLLLKDDRFVRDTTLLATGYVGEVSGMQIYKSNNIPTTTTTSGETTLTHYHIMAGYNGAISFAQQIDSVEAYRPEGGFKDAVKGLQLYGAKLVKPKGIAVLTVDKA